MADTRSPTTLLAQHAAKLRYEDLPPALVELVKRCILDTLGVSIAATTLAPEARIVADYVEDMGGRKVATVWGYGRKAPAPWGGLCQRQPGAHGRLR
jgi:2-methylcitrate dehydratase PrpD